MNAELKNWRRLLKSFPVKSSNQNIAEFKAEIKKELTSIVETKNAIQSELQIFKNNPGVIKPVNNDENMLGDLLFYLRSQKLMSTLMVCRQIEKIEVSDGVALISSEADLADLILNEKHKLELDNFFKSKGLSFKIKEKNKEIDPIEKLREYFGDKLIVK